jgi:hypothetical protein
MSAAAQGVAPAATACISNPAETSAVVNGPTLDTD